MTGLTKRQGEILRIIRDYIDRRGYSPSYDEIRRRAGLSSVATVHKHLSAMEARGVLRRLKHRSRAIELLDRDDGAGRLVSLAVLGQVAAGAPIEAIEDREEIDVPSEFVGRAETFVLRVRGDSMIEDHIRDGDLIVVERRVQAENGQTVVALVDGAEATVKRFYRENGHVRLQPANPRLQPMTYPPDRVEVRGVVIGLMRKYANR